ncbi:MAG: Mov34/MPN/PAD-1 family protein [Spirochaetia bacterium]|nr:Mov34/MPN/PAD-1 family protein [Spirochaetia bacterium]
MENKFPIWIVKAKQFAIEHPAVKNVSEIHELNNIYLLDVYFNVNLPGKFDIEGATKKGVKKVEIVTFEFNDKFPIIAPKIYLRHDFPRNFPHINPSTTKVNPCVYEGSLDELLQQPKWFDHILDQVSDWLEKAAADDLINSMQGWEPMRTDDVGGKIIYNKDALKAFPFNNNIYISKIKYKKFHYKKKESVFSLVPKQKIINDDKDTADLFVFLSDADKIVDKYICEPINNFAGLCEFAKSCYIDEFQTTVNEHITKYSKPFLFIIFIVKRPFNLINDDSQLEIFNFALEIELHKRKKNVYPTSKVFILQSINESNPRLLQKFSGIKSNNNKIMQLGCGSLGSKIALHLARNGCNEFFLVDYSAFSPHNNSRHALTDHGFFTSKSELLHKNFLDIGINSHFYIENIVDIFKDLPSCDIIIDSTANLSIRQFLNLTPIDVPIIHTALYNNGQLSLMLISDSSSNPNIDDLMAVVYSEALTNKTLQASLFNNKAVYSSIGQGCGSYTTICEDSIISLSAAAMSSKIQEIMINGLSDYDNIFIGNVSNNININWIVKKCPPLFIVPKISSSNINVRLLKSVEDEMNSISLSESPNEIGGVLIGHISYLTNTIIITNILPAPEDSICTPTYFELGTKGLKSKIKSIESKTNCMLTYVGTWHSHPKGGSSSTTDRETKRKLIVLRNYEPTVCLIWTSDQIFQI